MSDTWQPGVKNVFRRQWGQSQERSDFIISNQNYKRMLNSRLAALAFSALIFFAFSSCKKETTERSGPPEAAILLVIDEESIDNGNPPNNFSETDVNDQRAAIGLRETLLFFKENVGNTIELFTGEVGDEGWHAIKTIPTSWINAGPTSNGAQNYLAAGPGLGSGDDDREVLLDKIPNVTPLRATGLQMLVGKTIIAVVYDSDISTNYSPLNANLMGANLGLVAFDVLEVKERTDGSTSSLPRVKIFIRAIDETLAAPLLLFANAPTPQSSSVPFDIAPPAVVQAADLIVAP